MLACFTGFLSAGGKAGLEQPMENGTLISKKTRIDNSIKDCFVVPPRNDEKKSPADFVINEGFYISKKPD